MIYPSADKIDKEMESHFALVILAAKRARMIKEGARPQVNTASSNPLTIALEEIAEGRINYQFDETSLAGQEALADKEAVVGARTLETDGTETPERTDHLAAAASQLGAGLTSADLEEEGLIDEELTEDDEEEEEEIEVLVDEDVEELGA